MLGDSAGKLPSTARSSKSSAEEKIFSDARRIHGSNRPSVIYPEYKNREPQYNNEDIRRYLDEAKAHLDVIDFRRSRSVFAKKN